MMAGEGQRRWAYAVAGALFCLCGASVGAQGGFHRLGSFFPLGKGAGVAAAAFIAVGLYWIARGLQKNPPQ